MTAKSLDFGVWSRGSSCPNEWALLHVHGGSDALAFGLTGRDRAERCAASIGLYTTTDAPETGAALIVDADWAFDPALLDWVAQQPGRIVSKDGHVVLEHRSALGPACNALDGGDNVYMKELSKLAPPLLLPMASLARGPLERAIFDASYRGVTDLITKYVWPRPAFYLVRLFAAFRVPPNAVTVTGILLCMAAAWLFATGNYPAGIFAALAFMLFDTVDGKLARCTIRSSRLGDLLDHVTDVVHPPVWWICWYLGLSEAANAGNLIGQHLALAVILVVYIMQRLVEWAFVARFGFQIHFWQRFDSGFKLITSQRNIQLPIAAAMFVLAGQTAALQVLAIWALAAFTIHTTRLVQAMVQKHRNTPVRTWLSR